MPQPLVAGIDLGGTIVRAGVFDQAGSLLASDQTEIEAQRGFDLGFERMAALVEKTTSLCGVQDIHGIGISATGPVDISKGVINNPFTLPTWENVPIVDRLQQRFAVPVCLENDGDSAALGEFWQGAGQGVQRLYAITVGTGIGVACIINGKVYRGLDDFHPEGGHQIIDPSGPACYCGGKGCWESLASGTAIASQAQKGVRADPKGRGEYLLEAAEGQIKAIDARLVTEAARQGDPLGVQIVERAAYYFSIGVKNILMLFHPEMIVLSGGVMRSVDLFMPAIKEGFANVNHYVPAMHVRILPAKLGYYAGLYGAAYAIWKKLGKVSRNG